jgi:hypothetical protein
LSQISPILRMNEKSPVTSRSKTTTSRSLMACLYDLSACPTWVAESSPCTYAQDSASMGHDNQGRRLHCEDGTEPGLALHDALVCLRSLGQWVRLDDSFNFSLRYEIKGFVEIFGAVLLAAD